MKLIRLKPACKNNLWGGNKLREFYHKESADDIIAETWELSAHKNGPSTVANGPDAGMSFPDFIEKHGKRILGTEAASYADFPILIKLIDACDKLSIQVHPNNEQARAMEGQYGKTEMWVILEAEPDAFLYYGFKQEITKEEFRRRIEDGTLTEVLNQVFVHPGEVYFIPAGTLHAIGKGIVIAEIQQSSDVTYRIFDYMRRGKDGKLRELHVDKAVEVTNCVPPTPYEATDGHLVTCPYFTVDRAEAPYLGFCGPESFVHVLVTDGEGELRSGDEVLSVRKGDSVFIPASGGHFSLSGTAKALISRL